MSGEPLCCCEYENIQGEKSHILACCCDCEALDQAFEKCITCQKVPSSMVDRILSTIGDRCRLPGIFGRGAVKIKLDIIIPIVTVPTCLCIATNGPITSVIVLCFMPVFMLWFYYAWTRRHKQTRTKFFFIWGLISSFSAAVIFQSFTVAYREILLWENMLLITCSFLTLYFMTRAKLNQKSVPSQLRSFSQSRNREYYVNSDGLSENNVAQTETINSQNEFTKINMQENNKSKFPESVEEMTAPTLAEAEVKWVDSRPIKDGKLKTWCHDCKVKKPPRSGHCNICKTCIDVRDHHCVWIDCCIGFHNHKSFLASMVLFIFCGFYGSHLTLTTVCTPEMYFDYFLLPNDCRFLYIDFQTSISFVCACYSIIASCIMSVGLIHQVLLISQNVTSQELHMANVRHMTTLYGLVAIKNVHNQGFVLNWINFFNGSRMKSNMIKM